MKKIVYSFLLLLGISFSCTSASGSNLPYYPSVHFTKIICIDGYQFVVFTDPLIGLINEQGGITQIFHRWFSTNAYRTVPARCTSEKPKEEDFWEDDE